MSANGNYVATVNAVLMGLPRLFTDLTDTPVSFAGESLKNARVNLAEDAIEFGGTSSGLEVLTEESQLLFNGAAPGGWTDLQIFDAVGNKPRGLALIEFDCAVAANRNWLVRCNGETALVHGNAPYCGLTNNAIPSRLGYALVPCDDAGLIEWRCPNAGTAVVVTLRAFIADVNFVEPFPTGLLVHSGAAPMVWTGIDLGTGPALAIFRVIQTSVAAVRQCCFKRYGDTVGWPANPGMAGYTGHSRGQCDQNDMCYIYVPTDENGRVQWGDEFGDDWDVYLLGFIRNVTYHDVLVYNAMPLDKTLGAAYFQTLDLPVTSPVLAILKNDGDDIGLRQTGLTALFPHDGLQGVQTAGTWPGYMTQLTNRYGQLDLACSMPVGISPVYLQLTIP